MSHHNHNHKARKSPKKSSTNQDHQSGEAQCLKELRALIKDDNELTDFTPFLTDRFLLHFVRGRKCRVKEAFATLKNYIKVRKDKFPEIFKPLRPSSALRQKNFAKILKNRDEQGRFLLASYVKNWDPKVTPADDLIGEITLYVDELMNFEDAERHGVVLIIDMAGFGMKHAKTATPFQMHKIVSIFHAALPVRLKGTHIVNEMYLFNVLAKSLLQIMPKKLQDRLHFHSNNLHSLHKHISPDILPVSMGGKVPDEDAFMDLTEMEDRIRSKEKHYEQLAEKL